MAELTYTKQGDYLVPDVSAAPEESVQIGKYGRMRKSYLKEHRKATYQALIIKGTLNRHLAEIDQTARERVEQIVSEMAKSEGVNEKLKATDQMKWVGLMNNLKNSAEEIVLNELICN